MPHVLVKMLSGRSDKQKQAIAQAVTQAIVTTAGCEEDAVSVAIEDVEREDWIHKVYVPDIAGKPETIFKKSGYSPS